jgi:hypothetical protein
MTSKFINKSAQKILIFSRNANYARGLLCIKGNVLCKEGIAKNEK